MIDKPSGMTSHDVVSRVRRALNMRKVGHAGTLDPMATGVLVVLAGEGTKLVPFLTAEDKRYRASVQLGRSTDTLDAEGETLQTAPLPPWWPEQARDRIERMLASERSRTDQTPPVYSAIKIDGRAAHKRVRAGEDVDLPARPVAVRSLELVAEPTGDGRLELLLTVSKGYYVRSLARDLGDGLAVPAHLDALRREASGAFTLADAIALDDVCPEALIPIAAAARRALPDVRLTAAGVERTRCGAMLDDDDFEAAPPDGLAAWLDGEGALVAVGQRTEGRPKVVRVFNPPARKEQAEPQLNE